MIKRIWDWLRTHVVWITIEKDPKTDVRGGAAGFRWRF